ncbi:UAA transporter [Conidiobolus coronatus NRRL 28638]|uniref:UAA transporter n=1 Tax=Conidiobolus coronatus (strain ATCC 28846 / CBS 209.66 / NRRL 28638) TaxID=796925 RepID=A0A137NZK4_CONC2|nr:UAA transporter [Conidiobolus coronatus NRRL 28638]|eukprot:KXN68273.1 UAA transporter [Conidiobolus coronatus NRRL 28638]
MSNIISSLVGITTFEIIMSVGFIMGGCCSNAYFLEKIVKDAPSSGKFITFTQFLFLTLTGLYTNLEFKNYMPTLKKRNIPITRWLLVVCLFYSSSLLNNIAFDYNIPMILHIVFRSGSLFASMGLGWLFMNKKYNKKQVISITCVTIGVIITTLNSVNSKKSKSREDGEFNLSGQLVGIFILTLGLIASSGMSLLNEHTYKQFGKHTKESLFYTHLLSLPLFLPFISDIKSSMIDYINSDPIELQGVASELLNLAGIGNTPKLILYLVGNLITQYYCISGVRRLSAQSSALVINLVLTLRKMVSIIISVVYLGTTVNNQFILGAVLAFGGALVFSLSKSKPETVGGKMEDKKKKSE